MNPGYELKIDTEIEKQPKQEDINYPPEQPPNKTSVPKIAGVLLILSGAITLLFVIPIITIDISTIESLDIITQFQKATNDPSITGEQIRGFLSLCGTIIAVLSVFPILGGILSIKRKLWGIAVGCSILGLSTFLLIVPGIFSLVGLILLVISRKEYK